MDPSSPYGFVHKWCTPHNWIWLVGFPINDDPTWGAKGGYHHGEPHLSPFAPCAMAHSPSGGGHAPRALDPHRALASAAGATCVSAPMMPRVKDDTGWIWLDDLSKSIKIINLAVHSLQSIAIIVITDDSSPAADLMVQQLIVDHYSPVSESASKHH